MNQLVTGFYRRFSTRDLESFKDHLKMMPAVHRTASIALLAGLAPAIEVQTMNEREAGTIWDMKYAALLKEDLKSLKQDVMLSHAAILTAARDVYIRRHTLSPYDVLWAYKTHYLPVLIEKEYKGILSESEKGIFDVLRKYCDKFNLITEMPDDGGRPIHPIVNDVYNELFNDKVTSSNAEACRQRCREVTQVCWWIINSSSIIGDEGWQNPEGCISATPLYNVVLEVLANAISNREGNFEFLHAEDEIGKQVVVAYKKALFSTLLGYTWVNEFPPRVNSGYPSSPYALESFDNVADPTFATVNLPIAGLSIMTPEDIEDVQWNEEQQQMMNEVAISMECIQSCAGRIDKLLAIRETIADSGKGYTLEDLHEIDHRIPVADSYSMEEVTEYLKIALEFLSKHLNKIIPIIAAIAVGFFGRWLQKKLQRVVSPFGDELEQSLNRDAAIDVLVSGKVAPKDEPSREALGLNRDKSSAAMAIMLNHYNNQLDADIISPGSAYTEETILQTLEAHVKVMEMAYTRLGDIAKQMHVICTGNVSTQEVTRELKRLKEQFHLHDIYKLPYTRLPLFKLIKEQGGKGPIANLDYNTFAFEVHESVQANDAFWKVELMDAHGNRAVPLYNISPYSGSKDSHKGQLHSVDEKFLVKGLYDIKEVPGSKITTGLTQCKSLERAGKNTMAEVDKLKQSTFTYVFKDKGKITCWPETMSGQEYKGSMHGSAFTPEQITQILPHSRIMMNAVSGLTVILESFKDAAYIATRINHMVINFKKYKAIVAAEEKEYEHALKTWRSKQNK